ncbi:mannosyltransferase YkcB-related protein [Curtobacterium poinsettiae]
MPGGTDGPGGPASGSDHGGSDSTSDSQQGPGGTPPEGASGEAPEGATGQAPGGTTEGSDGAGSEAGSGTGLQAGGGGTGGGTSTSSALRKLLEASDAKWAAAVNGSQSAAQLELDTDTAVMAIGGWSSDPAPTLAQFKAAVADGDIGYYVSSGSRGGMGGGSSTASAIQEWVAANYGSTTVGGQTVYDLSSTE